MRHKLDKWSLGWMITCLILVILLPLVLGFGLYWKSSELLKSDSLMTLLFSGTWKPFQGQFGFFPFLVSSIWVTVVSLAIAGPVCLLTAIFLTQYAPGRFLRWMQPVIDILAGIPSVIFGVWGILVVVPMISRYIAPWTGHTSSGYTILAGGIVLSVMIIPFILNILIDVFQSIPRELKEASLSLGASHWETVKFVLVRKAFPGIVSALGLGISRAFGETIAVLMVVGNVIQVPKGLLDPGYPLPALIANNYGEMMSIPLYDSALMFSALVLFGVVLVFNFFSRMAIMKIERSL